MPLHSYTTTLPHNGSSFIFILILLNIMTSMKIKLFKLKYVPTIDLDSLANLSSVLHVDLSMMLILSLVTVQITISMQSMLYY